jgi:hypothetical protein
VKALYERVFSANLPQRRSTTMNAFKQKCLASYRANRLKGLKASEALRMSKHDARYESGIKTHMMPGEGSAITELSNGWSIAVEVMHDDLMEAPWNCDDGVGVVLPIPWEGYEGSFGIGSRRDSLYYDYRASLKKALSEGWESIPYGTGSKMDQAHRAVLADYNRLYAWAIWDWGYVVMSVSLLDEGGKEIAKEQVGGYESSDSAYLCSEARYWAAGMIRRERRARKAAERSARIASRFKDALMCGI